jgi:peptidoglycan/LPS O-acetylase OafA/YrhL
VEPAEAVAVLLDRRDTTVDGLRGVAVMLVVLRHVMRTDVFGLHWFHSVQLGRMGVHLFFVISGYVIGALLTNQPSDLRTLGRFMARRLVRLTPPYYVAIALSIALTTAIYQHVYPTGHYVDLRPDLLLCSLSYVCYPLGLDMYVPVGWSLEIEVQFYLLACGIVPLAVWLGAPAAWLAAAALLALSPLVPATTALYYAPPFVIGMAIVALRRGALGLPLFVAITAAIAAGWAWMLADPWTGAIVALGGLAIAVRFPMPRPLVWIGGISYSLYLTHEKLGPPFVRGIKKLGFSTVDTGWLILWTGLAVAGCIAAAWVMHRLVELPAVRWSHAVRVPRAQASNTSPGP